MMLKNTKIRKERSFRYLISDKLNSNPASTCFLFTIRLPTLV